MAFKRRSDGRYLKGLPAFKRIFPYLMQTRNESLVYFPLKIDMTGTLAYLEAKNAGKAKEDRISVFQVFLGAIARTLGLRPDLNHFIAGRRIYEHSDISVSFIVKKAFTEEAPESQARIVFTGEESLDEVKSRVDSHIRRARGETKGGDDRLVDLVASLPRPVINLVVRLIKSLDYHNILPKALREVIPLFTSVYVTNVGSIGLDAPFHHLYEVGNACIFMSIGKIHPEPVVDAEGRIVAHECVNIAFTLDERITEGFYCAKSILLFQRLVERPELLQSSDLSVDCILG